jgi:hypothetical protein
VKLLSNINQQSGMTAMSRIVRQPRELKNLNNIKCRTGIFRRIAPEHGVK